MPTGGEERSGGGGSPQKTCSRNLGVLPADTTPARHYFLPAFLDSASQLHMISTCYDTTFENEFLLANLIPVGEKFQRLTSYFYAYKRVNLLDNLSEKWGVL